MLYPSCRLQTFFWFPMYRCKYLHQGYTDSTCVFTCLRAHEHRACLIKHATFLFQNLYLIWSTQLQNNIFYCQYLRLQVFWISNSNPPLISFVITWVESNLLISILIQGLSKRFERFKFGIFYLLIVKIRYNFKM